MVSDPPCLGGTWKFWVNSRGGGGPEKFSYFRGDLNLRGDLNFKGGAAQYPGDDNP